MGRGDPLQTPYVSHFPDYQGNAITMTVNFDNTSRAIIDGTVQRDDDCVYSRILVGLGEDGTPDTTVSQWSAPAGGSTAITAAEFAAFGFGTIEEFMVPQITAAP